MKNFFWATCLGLTFCSGALADTLPTPEGVVVLTVSGEISNQTTQGAVTLDLEMLKNMEQITFVTKTIWLEGDIEFTGVSLQAILQYAGATGTSVSATALNDYMVEIPLNEIDSAAPIVAYLMNGEEMTARGKGPLWIVYPYDSDTKYRSEVVYSRSIWQLDRIVSNK